MSTLETLYLSNPSDDAAWREYNQRRASKVAEIAEYVARAALSDVNPMMVAEDIMQAAEEQGRVHGDDVSGEIAARFTKSGNPVPLTI